jgi:hypothetical protein
MSDDRFSNDARAFLRWRRAQERARDERFSWCEPKTDRRHDLAIQNCMKSRVKDWRMRNASGQGAWVIS